MNKTLLEILQTKNAGLSEVLINWKNYNDDTIILSLSELKKRNIPINDQIQNLISDFEVSKGKSVSEIESEFFDRKGAS
ncbi:MAG: hypothetical protein EOO19_04055 [Chryseobacterium sp.]|nr:MAG: hypothetical protein EOO19_04055 [Chryseobacterium sp.]